MSAVTPVPGRISPRFLLSASRVRRVQGSGSVVSATATACRNHAPFGTCASRYGYGCAGAGMSSTAAARGRHCTIGSLKTPRYTRAQTKPSGMLTIPATTPSRSLEAAGLTGGPNAMFPGARRKRPGDMPTLAVKWLVNEPRLL
jgi:hypothetical protein